MRTTGSYLKNAEEAFYLDFSEANRYLWGGMFLKNEKRMNKPTTNFHIIWDL